MDIVINNENNYPIEVSYEDTMKKIASLALKKEGLEDNYEVGLTYVSKEEIRDLNREYRNIDKVTDVLSFPLIEDFTSDENLLGDVVISYEVAEEQAKDYGHSLEREIMFLFTHSILHLLGYDHIEDEDRVIMEERQREVLDELKITR
jgi:probable rRNA maturation factor